MEQVTEKLICSECNCEIVDEAEFIDNDGCAMIVSASQLKRGEA